jgi:histidyl-tRNA synthetase
MERLLLVMERNQAEIPEPALIDVFVCSHGNQARIAAAALVKQLRENGVRSDMDHVGRSVKAQFKYAGKTGAKKVVVIGEQELLDGNYMVKHMETGEEMLVRKEHILKLI